MKRTIVFILAAALLMIPAAAGAGAGAGGGGPARTHTVYLATPACIFAGGLAWTSRLQVRNPDPYSPFTLESVEFRAPGGSLVKSYLDEPVEVPPWSSLTFLASPWSVGGPGEEVWFDANGGRPFFLVRYNARHLLNEPAISASKTGMTGGQGKALDIAYPHEINYAAPGFGWLGCRKYQGGVVYVGSAVGVQAAGLVWGTRVAVHNLDPYRGLTVQAVDFYDPQGVLLKRLLPSPLALGPFHSATWGISPTTIGTPEYPYWIDSDGPRPFVIVHWTSPGLCNEPLIGAASFGTNPEGLLDVYVTFTGRTLHMPGGYNPVW